MKEDRPVFILHPSSLILFFAVLDRATDDVGLADRDGVGRAGAVAVAATDALVAFDPDVGGPGRAGRFDVPGRRAVLVGEQARELMDAGARRDLNAPVAVDALVLVDLELVVAEVAAACIDLDFLRVVA